MGRRVYVYGYGNPGRQDDGVGVKIADMIDTLAFPNVIAESGYQLNIETAADIAKADVVFFVDASSKGAEPFFFKKIEPALEISFSTHALSPDSFMAVCSELCSKTVPAYMLAVRGYAWEFNEPMTAKAEYNMKKALEFLTEKIRCEQSDSLP